MALVLRQAGLRMREELVLARNMRAAAAPIGGGSVIVVSGLVRQCDAARARALVRDCVGGNASVVALLQHYPAGSFPRDVANIIGFHKHTLPGATTGAGPGGFEACASELEAAVEGSACALVLGRAWFEEAGEPTCPTLRDTALTTNTGRSVLQTLAVGRAYDWARFYLPTSAAADASSSGVVVRARLDGVACVPPAPAAPRPSALVVNSLNLDGLTAAALFNDQYAAMSAELAPTYFGAWRVWRPFDCSRICFASAGDLHAGQYVGLAQRCTAEVPLTMWLGARGLLRGLRPGSGGKAAGVPALRSLGENVVLRDPRHPRWRPPRAPQAPAEAVAHVGPPTRGTPDEDAAGAAAAREALADSLRERLCPACWPDCMAAPRRNWRHCALFGARNPCHNFRAHGPRACVSSWQPAAAASGRNVSTADREECIVSEVFWETGTDPCACIAYRRRGGSQRIVRIDGRHPGGTATRGAAGDEQPGGAPLAGAAAAASAPHARTAGSDPRARVACAEFFGRARMPGRAEHAWDVVTREDVLLGRRLPRSPRLFSPYSRLLMPAPRARRAPPLEAKPPIAAPGAPLPLPGAPPLPMPVDLVALVEVPKAASSTIKYVTGTLYANVSDAQGRAERARLRLALSRAQAVVAMATRREPVARALSAYGTITARMLRRCVRRKGGNATAECPPWMFAPTGAARLAGFVDWLASGELVRLAEAPGTGAHTATTLRHAYSQAYWLCLYPGPIHRLVATEAMPQALTDVLSEVGGVLHGEDTAVVVADASQPPPPGHAPRARRYEMGNRNEGGLDRDALIGSLGEAERSRVLAQLRSYYAHDYACLGEYYSGRAAISIYRHQQPRRET